MTQIWATEAPADTEPTPNAMAKTPIAAPSVTEAAMTWRSSGGVGTEPHHGERWEIEHDGVITALPGDLLGHR